MSIVTLADFSPSKDYFIGIDSDGCVFDNMALKHRECFCPAFVDSFGLGEVSSYALEAWEFVNLYSRSRGLNRFPALLRFVELLARRPELLDRGVAVPRLTSLASWVRSSKQLSNDALAAACAASGDPELERVLEWSTTVNANVRRIVRDFPPFPDVRLALAKAGELADIVVVSQTPSEAIAREWAQAGIDAFVSCVAGQECGTKSMAIAAAGRTRHYAKDRVMMIGDAPGDEAAARENGALFFPIVPGREDRSWKLFLDEGLDRFIGGDFAGEFEAALAREFEDSLPERAPWEAA